MTSTHFGYYYLKGGHTAVVQNVSFSHDFNVWPYSRQTLNAAVRTILNQTGKRMERRGGHNKAIWPIRTITLGCLHIVFRYKLIYSLARAQPKLKHEPAEENESGDGGGRDEDESEYESNDETCLASAMVDTKCRRLRSVNTDYCNEHDIGGLHVG